MARANIQIDQRSVRRLAKSFKKLQKIIDLNTPTVLNDSAREIMHISKVKAPFFTGSTIHSCTVSDVSGTKGEKQEISISYGVENDPINPHSGKRVSEYVAEIHEGLSDTPLVTGTPFFLSHPVRDYERQFHDNVADMVIHSINEVGSGRF